MPVRAADPVFPPGSRLGLVPPAGMVASDKFDGFADPEKDAAILITVLPATAYPQIEKTLDVDALQEERRQLGKTRADATQLRQGFSSHRPARRLKRRGTENGCWLPTASDLTALVTVQVPEQDSAYPDSVVRAALATLSVRANVPEAEELGLLPFCGRRPCRVPRRRRSSRPRAHAERSCRTAKMLTQEASTETGSMRVYSSPPCPARRRNRTTAPTSPDCRSTRSAGSGK